MGGVWTMLMRTERSNLIRPKYRSHFLSQVLRHHRLLINSIDGPQCRLVIVRPLPLDQSVSPLRLLHRIDQLQSGLHRTLAPLVLLLKIILDRLVQMRNYNYHLSFDQLMAHLDNNDTIPQFQI